MSDPLKVCIIAGSLPPEACGVGDFTAGLAGALRSRGVEVVLLHRSRWDLAAVPAIVGAVRRERPDIVHMQYPTHGFGKSLVPHLLHVALAGWRRVVTLHDYAGQKTAKHILMSAFAMGGWTILTAPDDERAFRRNHPWMRQRTAVVPIASNIPGGRWQPEGPFTIVHFGMLRPGKGIEEFVELTRLCRERGRPYRSRFIGAVLPHGKAYAETIFQSARDLAIDWHLDVAAEVASDLLRTSHVAYFAPVLGVHERRGSMLAAAANGTPIIAKTGADTPASLLPFILTASSPAEALSVIDGLQTPGALVEQSIKSQKLAQVYSWGSITEQYIALFHDIVSGRAPQTVSVASR